MPGEGESMTLTCLSGDPPIEIHLRRSSRARRMTLRVSGLDGSVSLTLPNGAPEADALAFAEERRSWIEKARAKTSPPVGVSEGTVISIEGADVRIAYHGRRAPELHGGTFWLPRKAPGRAAEAFLKTIARERLVEACDRHAAALGVRYAQIALRDTRSRWGSCSAKGRLMFSWRLIMAPPGILDYVAAHEVAHLVRMDHSQAFWRVVAGICPDWEAHRACLRTQGGALHRVRFDSLSGEAV